MDSSPADNTSKPGDEQGVPSAEAIVALREVDSQHLFQGDKTIAIRHAGEIYRLLITRHNRLILQK